MDVALVRNVRDKSSVIDEHVVKKERVRRMPKADTIPVADYSTHGLCFRARAPRGLKLSVGIAIAVST